MTASESSTLDEHYKIQEDYLSDQTSTKKNCFPVFPKLLLHSECTFIILDRSRSGGTETQGTQHPFAMAGDVNLFFASSCPTKDEENGTENNLIPSATATNSLSAEINIMIAEAQSRGKGLAKESVVLMMSFALQSNPKITHFIAKISEKNTASLGLFSRLGFEEASRDSVWQEVLMVCRVDDATSKQHWITRAQQDYNFTITQQKHQPVVPAKVANEI